MAEKVCMSKEQIISLYDSLTVFGFWAAIGITALFVIGACVLSVIERIKKIIK